MVPAWKRRAFAGLGKSDACFDLWGASTARLIEEGRA